jgi:hypothetical protein
MGDTEVQTPTAPAPIHAVPLQAVAAPGGFPTAAPLAIIQEGSQVAGVVGNAQVDNRVLQQLGGLKRWSMFACFLLCLLFSRSRWLCV